MLIIHLEIPDSVYISKPEVQLTTDALTVHLKIAPATADICKHWYANKLRRSTNCLFTLISHLNDFTNH